MIRWNVLSRIQQEQRRLLEPLLIPIQVILVLLATVAAARWIASGNDLLMLRLLLLGIGGLLAMCIWFYPYVGLVITIASMPLQGVLTLIPYGQILTSALGGLALFAFVYQRQRVRLFNYGAQLSLVFALAFVIWQFVSYPQTSFYGNRNWLFTYFQLWILFWLSSELLTPKRQYVMMSVYVAACVISALYAFSQANIVEDFAAGSGLVRSQGLAENQNSLAFFLVLGFVFTSFLHRQVSPKYVRRATPLLMFAYGAQVLGVVGTVSRSGFLLLILAGIMLTLFWTAGGGNRRLRRIGIPILSLLFAAIFFVPNQYWTVMENTIFTEQINEAGNLGNRNALAEAGLRVFEDYPIAGVGINRFREVNRAYLDPRYINVAGRLPHNFYITLLAETGLIGFLLFMGWIAFSMRDLVYTMATRSSIYAPLGAIWLVAFVLFLFRGWTASTMHYDKMLWMMGGISIMIYQGARAEQRSRIPMNGTHD